MKSADGADMAFLDVKALVVILVSTGRTYRYIPSIKNSVKALQNHPSISCNGELF